MKKLRKIILDEYDAYHLYEIALEHFQINPREGICWLCLRIKKRIEKFLGEKSVKSIKYAVKKNPYCKIK